MKKNKLQFIVTTIITALAVVSCSTKNDTNNTITETQKKVQNPYENYGFVYKNYKVINDTIKSGDTFGGLIQPYLLPDSINVYQLTEKIKDSFNLRGIKIGKPYILFLNKENKKKLDAFVYINNKIDYTVINLQDTVAVLKKKKPVTIKKRTIAAEIKGSLSVTLDKKGVSPALTAELAKVYAYSIDFFKIQKNDKFAVTLHERFIDDSIYAGIEKIDATYFQHRGNDFFAFPYKVNAKKENFPSYYDETGKALKSMFLKAPLDYFRISSRFSPRRFHPVQKRWKAHGGTDYAAPRGTPIKTTASGTVIRTGYTAGNGNYVKIRHNTTYTTQYLHMSKILVKRGQYVKQGEVIGKVGSTGLATGPHVCYRFWKNGVQVDPYKQKLPSAKPMKKADKSSYLTYIKPLKKELDSIIKVTFK